MRKAPGLRLVAAHQPFEDGALAGIFPEAQKRLILHENRPPFGAPLGALPVVRTCSSSGLAAEGLFEGAWLNEECIQKEVRAEEANRKFMERYRSALTVGGKAFRFALDFEDLGQREGASQIAVIHIDGNGVGRVFQDIVMEEAHNDLRFKARMRAASDAIRQITQNALGKTLRDLSAALPGLKKQGVHLTKDYYPVRPLVDEGDELTVVCQGKLGLLFTSMYLENAEAEAAGHVGVLGRNLTFSAGVALVGQRFPFSRAYYLADALTGSAKRRAKLLSDGGSWLDFEIVREGTAGSLEQIRSQYRRVVPGSGNRPAVVRQLLRRPYRIGGDDRWSWQACEKRWKGFQSAHWARSVAKSLLSALSRGEEETQDLVSEIESRGRKLPEPTCGKGAWFQDVELKAWNTFYFDPLDYLDLHVLLDQAEGEQGKEGNAHVAVAN